MSLSDVAIRRPVFTTMLSMVLIVLGLLSIGRLGTELYPPVNFPFLTVLTVYPGAGPEDIERDVVKPIEDAVAGISGIDQIRSFTRTNAAFILLKFEMGTEVSEATNAVRDRLGTVEGSLPSGVEKPVLRQIDIGALPVMVATITSPGGINATRALVDERLRPALEQTTGVGAVNIIGGQDREILVNLDLDRLSALGLSASQVAQRLGADNLSMPIGELRQGTYAIGIRSEGQFASVADLASATTFQSQDGKQIRLSDIATVVDGYERPSRYVRNNLDDAVAIEIVKRSDANTVEVCETVKEKLAALTPTLGAGSSFEIISDQSLDIKANAEEVWIAIYFGGAIAVLVILFFLLDVRGTIISALALPTSIIGTFAAMGALGFSLNTMTLMAMSLAIGLLIDDAVVVRESITLRLEAGDPPEVAASRGTSEIALAVLATTMSLVAVFVPVAFMSGIVGQFFKQFGLTIACAVLLSLFVAFTLDPMLSARFAKVQHHDADSALVKGIRGVLDRIDEGYRDVLDLVIRRPGATIGLVSATLLATLVALALLPKEFVPAQDRGEILADLRLPVGSALEATSAASLRAETALMQLPDVKRVYTIIGHEDQTNRVRFRIRVTDKAHRDVPLSVIKERVRAVLEQTPRAEASLSEPAVIEGLGDFPPLILILQGPDLDGLMTEGRRVRDMLRDQKDSSDVRLSQDVGKPELVVRVDRTAAADRGVPTALVGATARLLVDGQVVGTLRDGGVEADIRLRADPRFSESPEAVAALPLPSPRPGLVTLGDVAKVGMEDGASTIEHYNRMRSVTINSQVAPGGALGGLVDGFFKDLDQAPLPDGYFLKVDGQARDMKDTIAAMGLAVLVAGLFIYMVLASQFESFLHPITLLTSIPMALVGAVAGLTITGNSISMGSLIGLILLMGLVTKNAILLVDGALAAIRDGHTPVEALRIAGPRRLRPILMTSAAMALGMLPTALSSGVGSEFRAPMAIAVIGGVLSSTVLTLLVVPVVFLGVERLRGLARR